MRRIRESTLDRLQVLEEGGQAARGVGAVDIVHVTEANPARNDSHHCLGRKQKRARCRVTSWRLTQPRHSRRPAPRGRWHLGAGQSPRCSRADRRRRCQGTRCCQQRPAVRVAATVDRCCTHQPPDVNMGGPLLGSGTAPRMGRAPVASAPGWPMPREGWLGQCAAGPQSGFPMAPAPAPPASQLPQLAPLPSKQQSLPCMPNAPGRSQYAVPAPHQPLSPQ